ncbi:bifunctional riboflavin kinase/FAD synthetase [Tenacibaculum sp. SG-28]|uniref:bifunctional riboflavin kinase/FAD synthetase n=1 Tax=Tenacibaculum sp. SG-28 TaxID=754426 RepID=UPI000CF4C3A8|nr:bifunctional riboflavin kinase/FAD synthetase [Tenacibaculum sp. SG-28]PQJ21765.1 riboflavin biosynthesis protein RibF [Tenacibaculum sp. SG-28]
MDVTHSIFDFKPSQETFVTIGTFDGVHVGHQKIIKKLVKNAKASGKKSVLLTFFPHPRMVLQKDVHIQLINTIREKTDLLEALGLDYLIIHPFSKEFSRMTALKFVRDILVEKLHTAKLIIGYDHHFGKNREGNIEQLTEYSHLYDFEVEEIPVQDIDDVSVSSTKIRKALLDGALKTANKYLGYTFSITGKVVTGKQLGSTIGFPTANIHIYENYKLIPKTGVYVVQSELNGSTYYGMMNIGNRPTVSGTYQTIEVHYFNCDQNLYDAEVCVYLLYYLREEKKFKSIENLKEQLRKDKTASLKFLEEQINLQ